MSKKMKKILIYDCEIIKAIRDPKKVDLAHIEYCNGWDDYENMGISVIGVNYITEEGMKYLIILLLITIV